MGLIIYQDIEPSVRREVLIVELSGGDYCSLWRLYGRRLLKRYLLLTICKNKLWADIDLVASSYCALGEKT